MSDRMIEHAHNSPHAHLPHHALINDHNSPQSVYHIQKPHINRGNSDTSFSAMSPQIPRTVSDVHIQQPQPIPAGMGLFQSPDCGRVQWNLGSEG